MPNYDLEERTAKFGEDIIDFAKKILREPVLLPLIGQLVRAATSVGATYCEADNAYSKKDFVNKIGLCKKEARETKHWLRMVARAQKPLEQESKRLAGEAQELNLIFCAIVNKCRKTDS
ncbi:MAG: four helix bundle protein [Candidatus Omnitrophica bacterium]|nr:four helix bundle protein [Candidatus Omnitrophota bacterium]